MTSSFLHAFANDKTASLGRLSSIPLHLSPTFSSPFITCLVIFTKSVTTSHRMHLEMFSLFKWSLSPGKKKREKIGISITPISVQCLKGQLYKKKEFVLQNCMYLHIIGALKHSKFHRIILFVNEAFGRYSKLLKY